MALIDIDFDFPIPENPPRKEDTETLNSVRKSVISRNKAKESIDAVFESSFDFGWEMGRNDERREVLEIIENVVTLIENGELQFDEVLSALSDRILEREQK
jgi:hypothetical protein